MPYITLAFIARSAMVAGAFTSRSPPLTRRAPVITSLLPSCGISSEPCTQSIRLRLGLVSVAAANESISSTLAYDEWRCSLECSINRGNVAGYEISYQMIDASGTTGCAAHLGDVAENAELALVEAQARQPRRLPAHVAQKAFSEPGLQILPANEADGINSWQLSQVVPVELAHLAVRSTS